MNKPIEHINLILKGTTKTFWL